MTRNFENPLSDAIYFLAYSLIAACTLVLAGILADCALSEELNRNRILSILLILVAFAASAGTRTRVSR